MTPTFFVSRPVFATRRVHPPERTITPPYAGKHSVQSSRVSPVRRTEGYADTPTIRNERSLLFSFHSPGGMEAGQCGVERRPPVQGRSELQAHDATVLHCPAVEGGKTWEDRPGRAIRHSLFPKHSTQVSDGRRALPREAAFDLRCRSYQATSSITSSLPLNETASPARLPASSA